MKAKAPNYLYPLATQRQIQWTKDAVRGTNSTSKAFSPRRVDAVKKEIVRNLVKDKKVSLRFGKPLRTRNNSNPMLKAGLPVDPMRAPDPRPGNAMHITNSKSAYKLGYR